MSTLSTALSANPKNFTEQTGFAPATADEKRITDALYATPATPATEFYPIENTLKPVFDANLPKLADRTGVSLQAQAAERREFAALMRSSGLHESPTTAAVLHTAWTEARLAGAQPGADEAEADAALATLNENTRRALCEEYGEVDAEALLQRVQAFVRRTPKLAEILRIGTVGSRLDVIQGLIEHVHRVNFR